LRCTGNRSLTRHADLTRPATTNAIANNCDISTGCRYGDPFFLLQIIDSNRFDKATGSRLWHILNMENEDAALGAENRHG
jgi:hypothetical protein